MKKTICAAAMLTLLAGSAFSQTMYKCGKTYQQTPCNSEDQKELKMWKMGSNDADSKYAAKAERAILLKEVFVGMKEKDVRRSWGNPDKINVSVGSYGRHEQWVYERGSISRSQYVYVENGVVSSVQGPDGNN